MPEKSQTETSKRHSSPPETAFGGDNTFFSSLPLFLVSSIAILRRDSSVAILPALQEPPLPVPNVWVTYYNILRGQECIFEETVRAKKNKNLRRRWR